MGFPPRGLGDEGKGVSGTILNGLLDGRSPDARMNAEREHTTVIPGSIPCDAVALDPESTAIEGPQVRAEILRHGRARWQLHPVVEHIPRLRRYARALLRDRDAADDLVQDTLERAVNKLHLWRPGSDMRAWLFSVMHNVFVNQIRQYRLVVALDPEQLPNAGVMPTQIDGVEIAAIEKALHRIPERQREVLLLVALEQMTYEEVATALSIPIGTVMSRLSRARERMRRLMSGSGGL